MRELNDLSLREMNERRVYLQLGAAFGPRLSCKTGHPLVRLDVLGTAIRIAGIVERVDTEENIRARKHFRPCQGEREKDGIARGYVRYRDPVRHLFRGPRFWYSDFGSQRRPSEGRKRNLGDEVALHTDCHRYPARGIQLNLVTLAVVERDGVARVSFQFRQEQAGGGIQTSAEQA